MNGFPAPVIIVSALFLLCCATTAIGALIAVLSGRVIRSVCGLATCCFGLAGLYYFLHSPFVAMMEILIYVGAVCVTIVFAIMLAEPEEPAPHQKPASRMWWGAVALTVASAIFWGLWRLATGTQWPKPDDLLNSGTVHDLGISLLTTYSMAFELISLALLVAILGALAIARTGRSKA
jgi:NADH:ubiquinone oxidoreductase subunit 6 (subunit J)